MDREFFSKEIRVLQRARQKFGHAEGSDPAARAAFEDLAEGFEKLLRQSRRLVTMGDRMQQKLNNLNDDLARSESRYRGIFENVTEGIYRCRADGTLIEVNPAMATMFGYVDSASMLTRITDICELFHSDEDYAAYCARLEGHGVRRQQARARRSHGGECWVEISAVTLEDDAGQGMCGGIVGVLTDVTERRKMLEDMCRLARTDGLTGLYNRRYFMDLARREVARSRRRSTPLSLLIVDVDFFKGVNDSYGHDVGDQALVSLSHVLKTSVREVDLVGRYGGEEFAVLLPEASVEVACEVAERLAGNIRRNTVSGVVPRLKLTVSVGLSTLVSPEDDLDGLVKFADIALYAAKKKGRDRVEIYRGGRRDGRGNAFCSEIFDSGETRQ